MLEHAATTAKPRVVTAGCTARRLLDTGREVEIVGFGLATYDASDTNTRLMQATVPITDPTCTLDPACNAAISPNGEFMAGGQGADACFGDSGGPVYVDTEDGHGHALMGIVSRGLAIPAAPCGGGGVYVRVDKVINWIQSVTGRTLAKTACRAPGTDGEWLDDEPGGCSAGATVGIGAGLVLLVCAWFLYRRERNSDLRHFDP
jgi:secreted trypsin-like serine protease